MPRQLYPRDKKLVVHWIDYRNVIMDYLQAIGYTIDKTRPNKHKNIAHSSLVMGSRLVLQVIRSPYFCHFFMHFCWRT